MKIPMPKGFQVPGDAKPGEPFEAVATLTLGDDGMLDLTALDGAKVATDEEEEKSEEGSPGMMDQEEMAEPDIKIPFEKR